MKTIVEYLEEGRTCLRNGDRAAALTAFEHVLARDPDNEFALFEMGNLAVMNGDEDGGVRKYEKVLELNPSNIVALVELGKVCFRKKEHDKARALFERVLGLDPADASAHIELGKIHRSLGNGDLARREFECAYQIDPARASLGEWIKKIDSVNGIRKGNPPYRVWLTWGMNYECNYRCSYCHAPKPEQQDFGKKVRYGAVYPGIRKITEAWDAVAEKYGSCRIRLDGGEPSVYPDFKEIVAHLSVKHWLQINTNLSFDAGQFCRDISPRQVRIDASFHSEYTSLKQFASKVAAFKENNFKIVVSFVAYPPFVDKIAEYKSVFEHMAVPFIIHPYSGEYNGRKYPADYDRREVKAIYNVDTESRGELEWRKAKTVTAETGTTACAPSRTESMRRCRMGQMYARIYPNGDAYRCCTDDGLLGLGNLYQGSFKLLEDVAPCEHPGCRCWRCMTIGEENRWLHTWIDDWEMPF